jgi:hypothetical protein
MQSVPMQQAAAAVATHVLHVADASQRGARRMHYKGTYIALRNSYCNAN